MARRSTKTAPAAIAAEVVTEEVQAPAQEVQTEEVQAVEAPAQEQEQAPEAAPEQEQAQELQPAAVEAWVETFKPKRINPAREDLLIAMAEAPDSGAEVWDSQPKTRDSTKAALLDGAFVSHDGKAAAITAKGRAFATFAALHREQVNPAPKAGKAPKVAKVPKVAKAPQDAKADPKPKHVSAKVTAADRVQGSSPRGRLSAIIHDIYGMNFMHAPVLALIWAASQMAELEGIENAKAALADINEARESMGLAPALPPYGSKLF